MKPEVLYISNEDRNMGGSSLSLMAMLEALGDSVEPVILFREEGPVSRFFREKGYRCLVIPFNRGTFNHKGIVRILRFIPHAISNAFIQHRCIRKVRAEIPGISLVHSNSGTVDIGLAIARKAHVPHIWHIREYLDLGLAQKPFPGWRSWKRKLLRSDLVIAISPGLLEHLGAAANAICLPDAVCHEKDAVLIEEKQPYVLFLAGTVSEVKRPDEAIRIFSGADLGGYTLKIAGNISPQMKETLTLLAGKCGIADRLQFIPFQSDVKGIISNAAAVLVCTGFEGMGRVAIEAMFYGCPVIARNSGGSADVLEHGSYGWLYSNEEEASAMLSKVCTDPSTDQLKESQENAIRKYSIENYAKEILKLYRQLT